MELLLFFNDTATTEIYTLSLHDALPIFAGEQGLDYQGRDYDDLAMRLIVAVVMLWAVGSAGAQADHRGDRENTRLNSSHAQIPYRAFCLKKKTHNYPHFHLHAY